MKTCFYCGEESSDLSAIPALWTERALPRKYAGQEVCRPCRKGMALTVVSSWTNYHEGKDEQICNGTAEDAIALLCDEFGFAYSLKLTTPVDREEHRLRLRDPL